MSGKHDKSVDDEQFTNLLLTGPIVIRGLGRGVKDALVRSAPSRHRAFAGDSEHAVDPTPVQQMLASGPTVAETGQSPELAEHAGSQEAGEAPASSLSATAVPKIDHVPQEDRVDDSADDDAPGGTAAQPHDEASTADSVVLDDSAASQHERSEVRAEQDADAEAADAMNVTAVEASGFDAFDALPPEPVIGSKDEAGESERAVDEPQVAEPDASPPELVVGDVAVGSGTGADLERHDAAIPPATDATFDDPAIDDEGSSDAEPEGVLATGTLADESSAPRDEPDRTGEEPAFDEFDALPPADADDLVDEAVASESGRDPLAAPTEVFDDEAPIEEASQSVDGAEVEPAEDSRPPEDCIAVLEAERAPEPEPPVGEESDDSDATLDQRDDDHGPVAEEGERPRAAPESEESAASFREGSEQHAAVESQEQMLVDGSITAAAADDSEHGEADIAHERASEDELEPGPEDADDLDDRSAVQDVAPETIAAAPGAAEGPWTSAEQLFNLPPRDERDGRDAAQEMDARSLESVGDHEADGQPVEHRATSEPERETGTTAEPEPTAERRHEPVIALAPESIRDSDTVGDVVEQRPVAETEAPAAAVAVAAAPPAAPRAPVARSSSSSRPPSGSSRRSIRERFGREAIGITVLVVLAVICAGLITAVAIKTRNDAAIAAREAAAYTPPPLATPEPATTEPVVAVIGDGSTSTAGSGVTAKQRWTSLLESSLGGTVDTDAATGRGYTAKSGSGDTFVQAASAVPSNAEVVVFFGGAADSNIAPLSLAKAATNAYAAAMKRAPDAKILVVGPAISSGAGTTDLAAIRDTLRGAAAVVQATWIDPIDKDWLPASKRTASPGDLTASDEKAIASKMQDAVEKALR